jgi:uncharacterized protein (TIGR03435 family)
MADRSTLTTRVSAVLNADVARGRTGIAWAATVGACAVVLATFVSPLTAVATRVQADVHLQNPASDSARFAAASVRPSPPGATRDLGGCCTVRYLPGGRISAVNVGVTDLIVSAYQLQYWQLSGGPPWADPDMMVTTDRYNLEAVADGNSTQDRMREMLRSLLADRFRLAIRRETKPGRTYELVVANGGPKLESVTTSEYRSSLRAGGGRLLAEQMTMADLARQLAGQVQTSVADRTGLAGIYRFSVVWTPDRFRLSGVGAPPQNGEPGIDPNGPTLFDALRDQIGLQLRETKGPVEYVVIERVERPTPNDAPQSPPIASLRTQSAAPPTPADFQFEAASVRRRTEPGGGFMGVRPGGRFMADGVSLQDLIVFSYLVQPYQIVDGPGWLDVERWDVNATGAAGTRNDTLAALRRLLADRFSLAVRRDVREIPVYALVLARGDGRLGPELKQSRVDCVALRAEAQKTGVIPPDAPKLCEAEGRLGSVRIAGAPLADLAPMLSTRVQRTVVDRTGLKGTWDLRLTYAPDPAQIPPGPLAPGVSFDPNGPSLFTAIQEQLGLRLEATRAPVEVLVIERAEFARDN